MSRGEHRNDVMYSAFSNIEASSASPAMVEKIGRALRRFKPGTFGGWKVTNRRKGNVKRRRKGAVS